ncbi:MAG TPA: hypothetical protein VEU08_00745 [Vicinamibacterales bacterium]|nr:hypothetical protein [Vicinamibacterales bacterium]
MVLAHGRIPNHQIAERVILPLQRLGSRDTGEGAELLLAENADVQFFGPLQLVGLFFFGGVIGGTETFSANHDHRRPRIHFVSRGSAEARDQFPRIAAAERAEFSSEDDGLSRERVQTIRKVRRA